jgi:hypothetical protein
MMSSLSSSVLSSRSSVAVWSRVPPRASAWAVSCLDAVAVCSSPSASGSRCPTYSVCSSGDWFGTNSTCVVRLRVRRRLELVEPFFRLDEFLRQPVDCGPQLCDLAL